MRFPIQLSELDLEDADLVIALKKVEHHTMMMVQFPAWADRITYWHINDLDCATADEALPICEAYVKSLVKTFLAVQTRPYAPTTPETYSFGIHCVSVLPSEYRV